EYAKAPEVTRTRLYLETLRSSLPKAKRRILVDDRLKGLVPLLDLNGNPPAGSNPVVRRQK
ncbi:MAG: HflK protein, partial [Myxococcota bacterium]